MAKILLMGSGGVGKTTYIHRLQGQGFRKEYLSTVLSGQHEIMVDDTPITLVEVAGQRKYSGHNDGAYSGADGAIIMFDKGRAYTIKDIPYWTKRIRDLCGDIPIIAVGNKADILDHKDCPINHMSISTRKDSDLLRPLRYLLGAINE